MVGKVLNLFLKCPNNRGLYHTSYYYIQFNIGTVKLYNNYPYVQLFFKKQIFSNAIVCTPISENSNQCTECK